MSKLPKLKVKEFPVFPWNRSEEVIYDFGQAEYCLPFDPHQAVSVVVEGQWISSYDKLVELAAQDRYKDKEFLKVELIPILDGG